MDRHCEVFRRPVRLLKGVIEDRARFLLHGAAIASGAEAEAALGVFGQFADGDAGHAINDSTAIIDCKELVF